MKPVRRSAINKILGSKGFALLADPKALLLQLAMGIKNHEQFRKLLLTVEPEKRQACYESMKPRLSFPAKPLDTYIAEGKEEAERKQLPVYDHETQSISDFHQPVKQSIHSIAEQAIAKELAGGSRDLVCFRCTKVQNVPIMNRRDAIVWAQKKGWRVGFKKAMCPVCVSEAAESEYQRAIQ